MRLTALVFVLGLSSGILALLLDPSVATIPETVVRHRLPVPLNVVAHAGGGLPEGVYSNAREAFDGSWEIGVRSFEADFSRTSDGKPVLVHDWGRWRSHWYGGPPGLLGDVAAAAFGPPSHVEFMGARMEVPGGPRRTQMDLGGIVGWLTVHPEAMLVTDIKRDNLAVLAEIARAAPESVRSRIVAQVYRPSEYAAAAAMGFGGVALTAYRSGMTDGDLAEFARTVTPCWIALPRERLSPTLVSSVNAHGVPVYAHTVNDPVDAALLAEMGVDGIYSDDLVPIPRPTDGSHASPQGACACRTCKSRPP